MGELPDPLRVALLAGTLEFGGAEKQLVYMARALQGAGVRVRVYKTRQNHFAARVEFRRMLVRKPVGWSGPLNHTVTNSNGAVADDAEFRQFGPAPRTPRASNGDELRRMDDV